MKKNTIGILSGLLALCCLVGCSTQEAKTLTDKVSAESSQSTVSEQAYESGRELSAEEQKREISQQREEISQQYSIYEQFGLTYDSEKDRFFYDGKMVRYFSDKISEENTNAFFYEDGTIDLKPVRDTSGSLTGLAIASDEEFADRTTKQNELKEELKSSGIADNANSYELGNPDEKDNTLDGYVEYGLSYDTSTQTWMYDKNAIHFFYDAENGTTYIDHGVPEGLNLKVIRDKKGNFEKFEHMTDTEVSKIIN